MQISSMAEFKSCVNASCLIHLYQISWCGWNSG